MSVGVEGTYYLPFEPPGGCPDTLVWVEKEHFCLIECIYPFFTDGELLANRIVLSVFGVIGFVLAYFYCFTALLRPTMLKFPNSNIFFMFFSSMILNAGLLFPLFLGDRYVFCDNSYENADSNWACLLSGFLYYYGYDSLYLWFTIYQVTTAARLYLVRLHKIWKYIFFIIGFGTWSLLVNVLGLSLNYYIHFPGLPTCAPVENNTFLYIAIHPMVYFLLLVNLFAMLLICIRLLMLKKRTGLSLYRLLKKQSRLLFLWLIFAAAIATFITLTVQRARLTDEDIEQGPINYIICLFENLDDSSNCNLLEEVGYPKFITFFMYSIFGGFFPIAVFLVFGFRKHMLLFWKEYLLYMIKNKTITFQFIPSFDPQTSKSTTINTIEDERESSSSSSALQKLKKRIKEV